MHTPRWWTWWRRTAAAARRRRRRRWRAGRGRSATCRTSGPDPPPLAVPVRSHAETPRRARSVRALFGGQLRAPRPLRRGLPRLAPPGGLPAVRGRARPQTRGNSPASRPRHPGGALRALPPSPDRTSGPYPPFPGPPPARRIRPRRARAAALRPRGPAQGTPPNHFGRTAGPVQPAGRVYTAVVSARRGLFCCSGEESC